MIRTCQYRIYPTASQKQQLNKIINVTRNWYNMCLDERKCAYEFEERTVSKVELDRNLKFFKKAMPLAKGIHSHFFQVANADLDKAFQAFFRRIKSGEKAGYPRFKSYIRFNSIGLKQYGNGFKQYGHKLKITGVGRIAVRWHREIADGKTHKIKTCRISRQAGKWYVSLTVEIEDPVPLPKTGNIVGLDVGIASLYTTSNGDKAENPQYYRHDQAKLRQLQRKLARAQRGSQNRKKALWAVQRQQAHVANQRKDYLEKLTTELIRHNDFIAVEDLTIKNMVRNHHLSKSILDSGWGYFVKRLSDKAAEAGRLVIQVAPHYTSKTCSNCGTIFEGLKLSDRWVTCGCGLSLDRDENAAINILNKALGSDGTLKHNVGGCVERVSEATPL